MEASVYLQDRLSERVRDAFGSLPDRYLGADPGFDATFEIRLGDVGRVWSVRAREDSCEVRPSPADDPDTVIGTDAATWLALREGRLSGLDAFASRRLYARGDLDLALCFEGLFQLPNGRPPLIRLGEVDLPQARVSALVSGHGPEHVVCLHGLGSNKTSFFETISTLSPQATVHAIDLPGFGSSSKPARGRYDAPWFSAAVKSYLDAQGIERAHLIGNSMGGRIALEVALDEPGRVSSLSLLSPALAFRRRRAFVPLVRLLRPELAAIPHPMRTAQVRAQLWSMFARPERLDPAAADVAADEFCRVYRSRSARVAFFAALRNIYLDAPYGERGFWTRLERLQPPALFVWGDSDRLVPCGFSRHVASALPHTRQVTLEECGHVPQVELPERTNALIRELIESTVSPASERTIESPRWPRLRRSPSARRRTGIPRALRTRPGEA